MGLSRDIIRQVAFRKRRAMLKKIADFIYDLPAPVNLRIIWTIGRILGLVLVRQLLRGILLSFHYVADWEKAFNCVIHLERDVVRGWFWRRCHANGARAIIFLLYLHTARGLYFDSFSLYPKL